jgi:N,N-dimethylformamidase
MHSVDPTRLDLCRAYRDNPFGPHGPEVQKLIKLLRWERIESRYILVQPRRGDPWYLAHTTGPKAHALEIFRNQGFGDLRSAYWALFKARWEANAGARLVLDGVDDPVIPRPGEGELTLSAADRPILSYSDTFSVETGGRIEFKVSAEGAGAFRAEIVRLRCGDGTPEGPAFQEYPVETPVSGSYPARRQPIDAGSYVEIGAAADFALESFTLQARIWPTTSGKGPQALLANWDDASTAGYALAIDDEGALALYLGDGKDLFILGTGVPLLERQWYLAAASFDAATRQVWVGQRPLVQLPHGDTTASGQSGTDVLAAPGPGFRMAAWTARDAGRVAPGGHYNGKIDTPEVANRALSDAERAAFVARGTAADLSGALVARWDFSQEMSGTRIVDVSGKGRDGATVNLPTRAMKGWNWDGSEYNWTRKPEQYGAIHFHDDDLYDCGWETDFTFEVPADLASGIYCAKLTRDDHEDYCPFVVRPPLGEARAPLALLLPSASYWAYADRHSEVEWRERENVTGYWAALDPSALYLHEHPELGCSLYDEHSDGSGVCYSSRLRPVLNMQPKEKLWQFAADTHITDWLEAKGIAYDVITEDDLDAHGYALLKPYACVMTGTHPEYPSLRMQEAYETYKNEGGRFIYFGGNGFYWRVSYHPMLPGVLEMRRAEDGIRSWLAEGGEYYHSFTGELGGMWRRMGRAPQSVAGTGMAAQGFDFSCPYDRTEASFDPRAAFIFEGIGADEKIGDFGVLGGGAAGWEVDRADVALGTPPHALIVATATDFSAAYHWVKEELTHTHSANTGETSPMVRCDMVYYETPKGGAVFSTSSIAWAAALAHNGYDNNVSRISENVVRRFIDPEPLPQRQ